MKRLVKFLLLALLMSWVCVGLANQANAQDPDTLDVPQGYETLNLAVEGDTSATGEPKNVNRVYRLERGGYYLLNGSVNGLSGVPLRIVAADGDGPLPILIPAADETGASSRPFKPNDDATLKGLYVSGVDNLANFTSDTKNSVRGQKSRGRYVIDNCFFDYNYQSFVRMNSSKQKWFFTNSVFRNCGSMIDPGDSKFFDTRGKHQDSLVFRNCTFYSGTGRLIRSDRTPINYLEIDHVTVFQMGDRIETEKVVNAKITNNLFIDMQFEGNILSPGNPSDTMRAEIIDLDSLMAPEISAEEDRHIVISNNSFAMSPALLTWFDSVDSLYGPVLLNQTGQAMVANFPNIIAENNISEYPTFSDPPGLDSVLAYAKYRLESNQSNLNNPDIHPDRNGRVALADDPTSFGPAADDFDFDYPTSSVAYTHGEGGFPLGDLNWFPDKKAEWEQYVTSVDDENNFVAKQFSLSQNYPNPFNPSTLIKYGLKKNGAVTLAIYNILGQKVRTLINKKLQAAGSYAAKWDGRNDAGSFVPSGMYIYRLESGDQVQARKMLLLK